jgi:WD40 repeat protein
MALDKCISIWRVESAEQILILGPFSEQPSAFCFDQNGKWIAVSLQDRVELWDISTQERSASFPGKGNNIQILACRRGLIIGDERGLRIIDPRSGTHQLQFKGHYKGISALALDQDEVSLISAGMDQTLRVWEFDSAKLCWTFELRRKVSSVDVNFAGTIAVTFGESFGFLFPMGRGV